MKYVIFFIGMICFVACSEEQKEESKTENIEVAIIEKTIETDTIKEVEPTIEDTVSQGVNYADLLLSPLFFLPEEIAILQKYFDDSTIVAYDSSQVLLIEAKTDTAFNKAYLNLIAIRNHLMDIFYTIEFKGEEHEMYYPDYVIADFEPIDDAVFGIHSTCVAECTEFDFDIDLTELKPLTLETVGTTDDLLFEILELADGDFGGLGGGWHTWFVRTWDYGGGTLFGSGLHLKVLLKINELRAKAPSYTNLLKVYQDDLLRDIGSGIYMNEKEIVIVELKEVLALDFLTPEEKEPLNKYLSDWEANIEECEKCVSGKYQFGCQSYDCDWGG